MNIILISELINKNGSKISGDQKIDQDDSATTSPTEPPTTTDDFIKTTRQGKTRYMYRSFYTEDEKEDNIKLPKKDKNKKYPKNKLKENTVFTKKEFDREFVKKQEDSLYKNEIPNLEQIRETNPILIRKVNALKEIIEKNNSSGEEIAIILNFLLDLDLTQVPTEYKKILKNKLN